MSALANEDEETGWTEIKSKSKKNREKKIHEFTQLMNANSDNSDLEDEQNEYYSQAFALATEIGNKWIGKIPGTKMMCVMFYLSGNKLKYVYAFSGYPKSIGGRLKAVRKVTGVSAKKTKVCAEEHVLCKYSHTFLFSCAFNNDGYRRACNNGNKYGTHGCRKLLDEYGIIDLNAL